MNKLTVDDLKKAKCKFRGYYKYTFCYDILLDNKKIGELFYGGNPDTIYKFEVITDKFEPLSYFLNEDEFIELPKENEYSNKYGDIFIKLTSEVKK